MFRTIRNRLESEKGFTLIELLVVILIIGILAAIALPAFLNQREKGQDAESKSATRTAATAMETCSTERDGKYTGCSADVLKGIEPSLNNAPGGVAVTSATDTAYQVGTTSKSGKTFTISRAPTGIITRGGTGGSW